MIRNDIIFYTNDMKLNQQQAAKSVTLITSIFIFLSMICVSLKLIDNTFIAICVALCVSIPVIAYILTRIRIDIDEMKRHDERNKQLRYENAVLCEYLDMERQR